MNIPSAPSAYCKPMNGRVLGYDVRSWEETSWEWGDIPVVSTGVAYDRTTGNVYGCFRSDDNRGYVFGTVDYIVRKRTSIKQTGHRLMCLYGTSQCRYPATSIRRHISHYHITQASMSYRQTRHKVWIDSGKDYWFYIVYLHRFGQ